MKPQDVTANGGLDYAAFGEVSGRWRLDDR
jgi:hypothetical protein